MNPQIVSCQETAEPDADGWIMIQQRGQYGNPEDFFAKTFAEYKAGFGSVLREHWLGLDKLASLTREWKWELRVTLVNWTGGKYVAVFHNFRVGEGPRYELEVGEFDKGASNINGYIFMFHNRQAFSTMDNDQSYPRLNCSNKHGNGGWWYKNCYTSNLNGRNTPSRYINDEVTYSNDDGITTINENIKITSYKETKMEIRKLKL